MMRDHRIRRPVICAAVLLVSVLAALAAPRGRTVAIADVHGALPEFTAILEQTGLIDASHQWIGGKTVLVQLGDVVDRGPDSRGCLDLLMEVQRQTQRKNGEVIALLGDHEVMAMTGDLRYVSPQDYQSFATSQSGKVREAAYRSYLAFVSSRNDRAGEAASSDQAVRDAWMAEHPLGFFERRDALGPQGTYGRWLRGHDAVVQIGNVVFVHGGLSPALPFHDLRELNQRVRSELADFDSIWQLLSERKIIWKYMTIQEAAPEALKAWTNIQASDQADPELKAALQKFVSFSTWLINSPDGPLWYRGLAQNPESELETALDAMLARLKIQYIVIGHTPQPNGRINQRFGNRVFLTDTGMLAAVYGGRASALEIHDGGFTAYYSNEKSQVLPAAAGGVNSPKDLSNKSNRSQP